MASQRLESRAAELRTRWVGKYIEARNPGGAVVVGMLAKVEIIAESVFLFGEAQDIGFEFDHERGSIVEVGTYPPVLH